MVVLYPGSSARLSYTTFVDANAIPTAVHVEFPPQALADSWYAPSCAPLAQPRPAPGLRGSTRSRCPLANATSSSSYSRPPPTSVPSNTDAPNQVPDDLDVDDAAIFSQVHAGAHAIVVSTGVYGSVP